MDAFRLPDDVITMNDPRPKIMCAAKDCRRTTLRDVRLGDSLPAPADAGWFEIELPDTRRTVLFACSQRCAQLVAALVVMPGLRAMSEHEVLPE